MEEDRQKKHWNTHTGLHIVVFLPPKKSKYKVLCKFLEAKELHHWEKILARPGEKENYTEKSLKENKTNIPDVNPTED